MIFILASKNWLLSWPACGLLIILISLAFSDVLWCNIFTMSALWMLYNVFPFSLLHFEYQWLPSSIIWFFSSMIMSFRQP
uniref:Uncharacterized protein n=1 Tax=Anopheles darlingi TaxID=43151 RepID=A0A2M4D1A4_ANODA